jgi:ABC-type nitrate/sulfonate/bicarbonate transport system ATPase subunit
MDVVVEDVTQIWGEETTQVKALDRFSHRFRSRHFSCLLGPSGCGKSTLIQIVGGLEPATGGRVRIQDPQNAHYNRPLGADSVMVWQNLNLFPWRNVIDNIAFGLEMRGVSRAERYRRASAFIAAVGLRGFERHLPGQLSGGMRQRVALARALIMERPILLMDEPFAALDAQTKIVMQEELLKVFDQTQKTVLFVTHAIEEAILLGDEVVVMTARPGRIKEVIPTVAPLLEATRSVPIVFVIAIDPVGAGFVASLARPGGNATGFMAYEYSMSGKWLELLKEIAPRVTRVAVLRDPAVASGIGLFSAVQIVAPSLGVEAIPVDVRDPAEIDRAVKAFASGPNGGLIVIGGALATVHRQLIAALAARHKLPAVFGSRPYVTAGGLISYGPDLVDQFRRGAGYIDRILKGEKPADLPVQAPTKYELVINLKTAKALGLELPASVLARADEVLE